MIGDRTYKYTRHTTGTFLYPRIYSHSFGYTETSKKIAAASTTAVLGATAGSSSAQTITSGITNPDVPRALVLTVGGTAAGVQAGTVIVTGTNVEGKIITQNFNVPIAGTGTYNGTKAFRTVSSVYIPAQVGSSATFAIGTLAALGVNHRLFRDNTTVKVCTSSAAYGALTLQNAPTVVADEDDIENNLVTPATVPNGSLIFTICYTFDNWALAPVNDQPEYSTTTSTSSTSSSTSTTTITTSTSSTSTSITTTSISTSSTSSSTSSTSTSTTTTP